MKKYPETQEVWKAFETYDGGDRMQDTLIIIYRFAQKVVDLLCDNETIHGWDGDTSVEFRREQYEIFRDAFINEKLVVHEQFNFSGKIHPNEIYTYWCILKQCKDFDDDDQSLYWHAMTRGPIVEKYNPIW